MTNEQPTISVRGDYILVERPAGYEVRVSDQAASFLEISAACEEAGCHKVLIVGSRTKVELSTMEIYSLGEHISNLRMQVAIVESHDASAADVGFLENVVANRGRPLQFFESEREAKEWLQVQ